MNIRTVEEGAYAKCGQKQNGREGVNITCFCRCPLWIWMTPEGNSNVLMPTADNSLLTIYYSCYPCLLLREQASRQLFRFSSPLKLPHMARGTVMRPIRCWFWRYIYCLFVYSFLLSLYFLSYIFILNHLLSDLSTSSRIGPFCFQAWGRMRRPNLNVALVLELIMTIFCHVCMFGFVGFDLVFQY